MTFNSYEISEDAVGDPAAIFADAEADDEDDEDVADDGVDGGGDVAFVVVVFLWVVVVIVVVVVVFVNEKARNSRTLSLTLSAFLAVTLSTPFERKKLVWTSLSRLSLSPSSSSPSLSPSSSSWYSTSLTH